MRLCSAVLRHIRQHQRLELRFDPHLTLIGGPNEAGKSTVVEALHKGLFLKAGATGRGVEELRSRLYSGLPEVEISFEADGQRWQLRKRVSGASGTCLLSDDSGRVLRGAAAEEELARLLGIERLVEGRKINQLAERWAHFWVRQGDAAENVLSGDGSRYDIDRLVDQLQRRHNGSALESNLDRQVVDRLQQQLDQLFTPTGKVRAGSSLAQAISQEAESQRRLEEARDQLAEIEWAMERLRGIGERLGQIELHERPALQRLRNMEAEGVLRRAELERLEQQQLGLRQVAQQWLSLDRQLEDQGREKATRQERVDRGGRELEELDAQLQDAERDVQGLDHQRRLLIQQRELAQLLLNLIQLQEESRRLQDHRDRFQSLQVQAESVKKELMETPLITGEQVNDLRQAEQRRLQAETRCQAMATGVELLEANQTVWLGDQVLNHGQPQRLSQSAEIRVGEGVRLRISPGGGEALANARKQWGQSHGALDRLCQSLQVSCSEEAARVASQRQTLESQLQHLRQAAKAIPSWALLEEQIAALEPRRQRLAADLERHESLRRELEIGRGLALPEERADLEAWLDDLQRDAAETDRRITEAVGALDALRKTRAAHQKGLQVDRSRLEQLSGSMGTLMERRQLMQDSHGAAEALQLELNRREKDLSAQRASLSLLEQQLRVGLAALPLDERQRNLEEEKDQLLTERGQNEERCLHLGSRDPAAELESALAEWERNSRGRRAIEEQAEALQLLASLFHDARKDLSHRYSEPLREAIAAYLAEVTIHTPTIDFDPQHGFDNLSLRQANQTYGFDQLSGGMREQLSAALRLAMAEVLLPSFDDTLPLVFDDAFTAADPSRLTGVLRMLRRGADQGIQLILLSCSPDDYSSLMDRGGTVVQLETASDFPAAPEP